MKFSPAALDRIARYLENRPAGASSTEIAFRVLGAPDPSPRREGRAVDVLLAGDSRFRKVGAQQWIFVPPEPFEQRALLYGASRVARGDPRLRRIALLRVEEGEERGTALFDRRAGDPAPLPEEAARLASGARLVVFRTAFPFAIRRGEELPLLTEPEPVRLRLRLAGPLAPADLRSPERAAARLGVLWNESEDLRDEARLLRRIAEAGGAWIAGSAEEENLREESGEIPYLRDGGGEELERLPEGPGIYHLRDREGRLLYVGESRSLRSRVAGYFSGYGALSERKRAMIRRTARVEVRPLGSEAEALVEEWRAIRRRRPPYNEKIEVRSESFSDLDGRNRILFLPHADPARVVLLLFRRDGAFHRITARRNPKGTARLGASLRRFFAGAGGKREEGARAILGRWIRENREGITLLDADRYAGPEDLLRVVVECLRDPEITSGSGSERL